MSDETDFYRFLPKRHHFNHDYCFLIHDVMLETLNSLETAGLVQDVTIKFKNKKEKESFSQVEHGGKDVIDWMEENGYHAEVALLFYKRVFIALLSDFLHGIYEALDCSKKNKLTQSFLLLRKPITENLFYLEWLLARPAEFLITFWKKDINEIDFFAKRREQGFVLQIIKEVCFHEDVPSLEDPEIINEIRYKKDSVISFEPLCHQATHLITTRNDFYKTNNTNFNFIFSGVDAHNSQWDFIYEFLPIVLFHSFTVVEALTKWLGKRAAADFDVTNVRLYVGHALSKTFCSSGGFGQYDVTGLLSKIFNLSELQCGSCSQVFLPSVENYKVFCLRGALTCSNCSFELDFVSMYNEKAAIHIAEYETSMKKRKLKK